MEVIGIICEYNPFHNGHKYHIDKIKEMFPDSLIVLALNGYFLERGEISLLSKEEKTKIALENNIDIVVEIPFVFGSQAADVFAECGTLILDKLGCTKLVFGSESNDIEVLKRCASMQLKDSFNQKIKDYLDEGLNYPTALNKALGINIDSPNDLLGISYIKSIIKNNLNIEAISIKRTNDYHDTHSDEIIVSASNIREKYNQGLDVSKYTAYGDRLLKVNNELLFNIIKYKILTDNDLSKYLSVDEGIEYKLVKEIDNVNSLDELIDKVKSKRYTYNRIKRMLIHILVGFTKEDREKLSYDYIKLLGFNDKGQDYLRNLNTDVLVNRKISDSFVAQKYELKVAKIYEMLTGNNSYTFEINNKPIKNID